MKHLIMIIEQKKLLKYIKIILLEKFFFKRSIKSKKTYLVGYPFIRGLGKTTLIRKLAKKYNLKILTKYHYFSDKNYVMIRNIENMRNIIQNYNKENIFLVDGLDEKYVWTLLREGYTIIGYTL